MVWICQLLCPRRHCIVASAYECDDETLRPGREILEGVMAAGVINRKCGICGSVDLRYEERETPFTTLREAGPYILQCQRANLQTRKFMETAGMTNDRGGTN